MLRSFVYNNNPLLVRSGIRCSSLVRHFHISPVTHEESEGLEELLTSKNQRRRKVYQKLKLLVRNELESSFKAQNKAKLKILDQKLHLKIKYNPKIEGEFTDFGINKIQAKALIDNLPHITKPTPSQRRLLSVLHSRLSCVARNNQGTGNSLALVLYTLNYRRPDKNAITSLILVPTAQLVKQYAMYYGKVLNGYPYDRNQMVQFIYRGDSVTETNQEELLLKNTPHVLVATPQRLLDIISNHPDDPNFIKLDRLKSIACDEADTILLDENRHAKQNFKHSKPASILIDYIEKLRSTVVNNPPLQYCFLSGTDLSNRLQKLAEDKKWGNGRPFVAVGTPAIKSDEVVPRLRIPTNVNVGAVVVDEKLNLFDVKLKELPTGMAAMKKIKSEIAREFDDNYKSYRNHENRKTKSVSKLPMDLIDAIPRYIEKNNLQSKRALLVIPEGVSTPKLLQTLEQKGIFTKHIEQVDDVSNFFTTDSEQFSSSEPQFLMATVSSITGISFPNLDHIICLGIDSVLDSNSLMIVASRCRPNKSGVIDESDYSTYFSKKIYDSDKPRGTTTLLYPKTHFRMMERFALERMILKTGLSYLEPVVDEYENVDLNKYEKLFDDEGLQEMIANENEIEN